MIFLQIVLSVLLIPLANAQLMSGFVREQVGSLPQGRFMVSIVSVQSSIDHMYNHQGSKQAVSNSFNQNISFQKISNEEPLRGNQLAGLFKSNGVMLADQAGELNASVSGTISGKVPVLGYGLKDDLGIFFALPIIDFKINAQYQFRKSEKSLAFIKQLQNSDQVSVAKEFNVALNTSLESKLYRSHYDWNSNLNKSYFGDLQINLVKILVNSPEFKSQVQPFMILPTSNDRDLHDLYGFRAGEGRFGVGAKYAAQKHFLGFFQLNVGFSATYLFPSEQGRRLPKDSSDQLNEYLDSKVWVTGGMNYHSQVQVRYLFPKWVGLNLGLDWQQRFQESLYGSAFDSTVYHNAEAKTGSSLLTSYASIDLNSIQSFLSGGFLFPAIAEVGVGLPVQGKNAIAEPVIQLQGTMFF